MEQSSTDGEPRAEDLQANEQQEVLQRPEIDFEFVCPKCGYDKLEFIMDVIKNKPLGFKCGCGWQGTCRRILVNGKDFNGWAGVKSIAAGRPFVTHVEPIAYPECPECGEPVKCLMVTAEGIIHAEFSLVEGYTPKTYVADISDGEFSCPSCGTKLFDDERSAIDFMEEGDYDDNPT